MKKLKLRRPTPAMIVAMVASDRRRRRHGLRGQAKITYKGLDKDARLKVLPFSKTATGTNCDPLNAGTYVDCATVNVDGSTGFPRKYYISFDGNFEGIGGPGRGDCRLEADNAPISGTTIRVEAPVKTSQHGSGYGINIITAPLGGKHTLSVACNENENNLMVRQFQLSAFQVR